MCFSFTHTHNCRQQMRGFSPHTKRLSEMPAGCPIIQFNSDSNGSQCKGSIPQDHTPLQAPFTSRSQGCPQLWSNMATDQRVPQLLIGLDHLLEQLTEFRETLAYISQLLYNKGYDQGYGGTAGRRGTQGGVWKNPEHGGLCPHGVGVHHPHSSQVCSPAWKLSRNSPGRFIL